MHDMLVNVSMEQRVIVIDSVWTLVASKNSWSVDDKIFERQRGQWAEWEDVD